MGISEMEVRAAEAMNFSFENGVDVRTERRAGIRRDDDIYKGDRFESRVRRQNAAGKYASIDNSGANYS